MRPAPPLALWLVPSRAWPAVCLAVGAAAGAATAAWLAAHLEWSTWLRAGTIAVGALALGAWARTAAGRPGTVAVRWDGRQWWMDEVPGQLQAMIDLQAWMLLRHRAPGSPKVRWVAVAGASLVPVPDAAGHALSASPAEPAAAAGAPALAGPLAAAAHGPRTLPTTRGAAWAALRTALYSRALAADPAADPARQTLRP